MQLMATPFAVPQEAIDLLDHRTAGSRMCGISFFGLPTFLEIGHIVINSSRVGKAEAPYHLGKGRFDKDTTAYATNLAANS